MLALTAALRFRLTAAVLPGKKMIFLKIQFVNVILSILLKNLIIFGLCK